MSTDVKLAERILLSTLNANSPNTRTFCLKTKTMLDNMDDLRVRY